MSAYVVSQETINCVCSIAAENIAGWISTRQIDKFGRDIWALNAEAVSQRYAEPAEALPRFKYRAHQYSRIQQYKCLRCLIYQCSEGDVPESSLYKMLTTIADALAMMIVGKPGISIEQVRETIGRMPEYDKAQWGLYDIADVASWN